MTPPDDAAPAPEGNQSAPQARTASDYAIEHGEYLAQAAERYLVAVGALHSVPDVLEAAQSAPDAVRDNHHDHFRVLQSAIYEFRKRAQRAAPAPEGNQSTSLGLTRSSTPTAPERAEVAQPVPGMEDQRAISNALAFFGSCIRCGESWDDTCQQASDKAFAALGSLTSRLERESAAADMIAKERDALANEKKARSLIDPMTRLHNLCDGLAESRRESPYDEESWRLADESYQEKCRELAESRKAWEASTVQYSVDRAVLLERAESAEARIADMERELADKGRRIASLEAIIRDLLDESTGPGEKSLLRATTIDRAKE